MNRNILRDKIDQLKRQRNAVILAHNYQPGEIQDLADFVGDSLDLSRRAAATNADVIVFCGVHFMAETAAILSPQKTVLLPALEAGCPMADMADAEGVRQLRAAHPDAVTVCYVNTSAAVKAECDVCCTSANAVELVCRIPQEREVIFLPDRYLGAWVGRRTGHRMILWDGFCPTHFRIGPEHVARSRREHPDGVIVVHPECRSEVVDLADEVLSTGGMCRFARESDAETIVVGTEVGILHRLRKENPGKRFVPLAEEAVCPNMKRITLEKIVWSLETMGHRIEVPEAIRQRAARAVARMVEAVA